MSNKAKRAKQVKLRKQQNAKQLNRVRGTVKNFNLSDQEAAFYHKALANKQTPLQFVQEVAKEFTDALDSLGIITDTANEEELMQALRQAYPTVAESVDNANTYIVGVKKDIDSLVEKYAEEFKDLDNSNQSYLFSSQAMEEFSAIQQEMADNSPNLMLTLQQVLDTYTDLDNKFPGEENDN